MIAPSSIARTRSKSQAGIYIELQSIVSHRREIQRENIIYGKYVLYHVANRGLFQFGVYHVIVSLLRGQFQV